MRSGISRRRFLATTTATAGTLQLQTAAAPGVHELVGSGSNPIRGVRLLRSIALSPAPLEIFKRRSPRKLSGG